MQSRFLAYFAKTKEVVPEKLGKIIGASQASFDDLLNRPDTYSYAAPLIYPFEKAVQQNHLEQWFDIACFKMTKDLFDEQGSLQEDVFNLFNQKTASGIEILKTLYRNNKKEVVNAWIAKAYLRNYFINAALATITDQNQKELLAFSLDRFLTDIDLIYPKKIQTIEEIYQHLSEETKYIDIPEEIIKKNEALDDYTQKLLFKGAPDYFKFVELDSELNTNEELVATRNNRGIIIAKEGQKPLLNDINRSHWLNGKRYANPDLEKLKADILPEFKDNFDLIEKLYHQDVLAVPYQALTSHIEDATQHKFVHKRVSSLTVTETEAVMRVVLYDIKFTIFNPDGHEGKGSWDTINDIPGEIVFESRLQIKKDGDLSFKPEGFKFTTLAASNTVLRDLLTQSGYLKSLTEEQIKRINQERDGDWDKKAQFILGQEQKEEPEIPTIILEHPAPPIEPIVEEILTDELKEELEEESVLHIIPKQKLEPNIIKRNPNLSAFIIGAGIMTVLTMSVILLCIFVPPVGAAAAFIGGLSIAGAAFGSAAGVTLVGTTAAIVGTAVIGGLMAISLAIVTGISAGISAFIKRVKGKNSETEPASIVNIRGSRGMIDDVLGKNPGHKKRVRATSDSKLTASYESSGSYSPRLLAASDDKSNNAKSSAEEKSEKSISLD